MCNTAYHVIIFCYFFVANCYKQLMGHGCTGVCSSEHQWWLDTFMLTSISGRLSELGSIVNLVDR